MTSLGPELLSERRNRAGAFHVPSRFDAASLSPPRLSEELIMGMLIRQRRCCCPGV